MSVDTSWWNTELHLANVLQILKFKKMPTITREEHNRFPTKTPTISASLCETEARRAGGGDAPA